MNYSGYISKYLYARCKEASEDIIPIILDENERNFLDFCGVTYGKENNSKDNIVYFLKKSDLKRALHCF